MTIICMKPQFFLDKKLHFNIMKTPINESLTFIQTR
jgi:hypothetical protein